MREFSEVSEHCALRQMKPSFSLVSLLFPVRIFYWHVADLETLPRCLVRKWISNQRVLWIHFMTLMRLLTAFNEISSLQIESSTSTHSVYARKFLVGLIHYSSHSSKSVRRKT